MPPLRCKRMHPRDTPLPSICLVCVQLEAIGQAFIQTMSVSSLSDVSERGPMECVTSFMEEYEVQRQQRMSLQLELDRTNAIVEACKAKIAQDRDVMVRRLPAPACLCARACVCVGVPACARICRCKTAFTSHLITRTISPLLIPPSPTFCACRCVPFSPSPPNTVGLAAAHSHRRSLRRRPRSSRTRMKLFSSRTKRCRHRWP